MTRVRGMVTTSLPGLDNLPAVDSFDEPTVMGEDSVERIIWDVDFPGIERPQFAKASEIEDADSIEVIGITIEDQPYAFALDAMDVPRHHIVHLVTGDRRISATYCNLASCVRVLEADASQPALRIGGLDEQYQMVFLLGDQRYRQESPKIPMKDVPYTRTSFAQWRLLHPNTLVFMGKTTSS